MLTYQRRLDTRDAPILQVINSIVQEHPTWGVRLIHGYMREQGANVSFERVRRLYRKAGHAAQWRKRSS